MSTQQHTKGPWAIDSEQRTGGYLITTAGGGIATVTPRDPHPVVGNGISWGECEANARLIAAAPVLLSALEDLVEMIEVPDANCCCHISPPCNDCVDFGGIREALKFATCAIAKATGGAA